MIKEVTGDILLSETEAIVHSVAPMDHFDSGLALSIRKLYPSLYKDFRHYCKLHHPKAGSVWRWEGLGENATHVKIYNLMAQEEAVGHNSHPGPATLSNVRHALKDLAKKVKKDKISSIALPRVATGVGGLDWADVQPLINEYLGELDIPVIVYSTYTADVKADEGLLTEV